MTSNSKYFPLVFLAAAIAFGAFGALAVPRSFAQTYCHTITSPQTFPLTESFAAPYDVFSAGQEAVIKIICSAPMATAQIGNGKINNYIFEEGYAYRENAWQRETLGGSTKTGNWFVGNATANISVSRAQLPQTNFFVAYMCNYVNSAWQCGCKAQGDCIANRWSLQIFSGPPSVLSLPEMEFTQSISSIKPGGSVTLTWRAISGATRCFAYGDWTGDKAFSGQETITNIQKDERYYFQCDGPGGSRMLLIQVWLLPPGQEGFAPVN